MLGQPVDPAEFARWSEEEIAGDEPEEPPAASPSAPRRRIDEFELLSELGHGNMGTVYRAWQPSLGRQVALKVVSGANDAKAKARFRREVRALGRVDHPNLVKIFTSGFEEEPCYYTMELVEGASLAAVSDTLHSRSTTAAGVDLAGWREALSTACEESRKAEKSLSSAGEEPAIVPPPAGVRQSAPTPDLKPGDRGYVHQVVELMRQVAMAAHALHAAGVVHRDIKPANIMVTADGAQAVLMDLGIAQLADDVEGRITRTRQFVGTVRYASPEQVLSVGKVDARSDVYSLGATLWELLTLRPIHDATDETPDAEVMFRITSKEPDRIRKHHPGIARDLEAIVQKCLEKDPSRRYATASELADDLGRWQRGELVSAQPLTFGYLASKFVKRHKLPIATAAGILILIIGGVIAAFVNIDREHRAALKANTLLKQQQEETEKALIASEVNRTLAEKRFGEKVSSLDEMLQRFSDDRLKVMPGSQEVRLRFLEEGANQYEQILRERPDDPTVKGRLADNYREVGVLRGEIIGSQSEALPALKKAVELRRQLVAAAPEDPAASLALGNALFQLAQVHWEQRQPKEAALPIQESVTVLTGLVERRPDDPAIKAALGRALTRFASVKPEVGAEKTVRHALELLKEANKALPNDAEFLTDLACASNNLVAAFPVERQSGSEAIALFDEARKSAKKSLALNPTSSVTHNIHDRAVENLARRLAGAGRIDEAVRMLEEAVANGKVFTRRNPAVLWGYRSLTSVQTELARTFQRLAKYDQAIEAWEDVARVNEGLTQRDPRNPDYPYERINALLEIANIERLERGPIAPKPSTPCNERPLGLPRFCTSTRATPTYSRRL